jgi:hypothetical protein
MKSFQKEVFMDKENLKSIKSSNSKRYINGQLVTVDSKNFKIQNAAQILRQNNVLPKLQGGVGQDTFRDVTDGESQLQGGAGQDTFSNPVAVSMAVLFAVGITPVYNLKRNFSFLQTQDMIPLRNPNIFEEDRFKELQNKNIKADDKFKDSSNPFYNLDDSVSSAKAAQIKQLKSSANAINPTNTAVAIFDLNIINSNTLKLRQFR